MANKAYDGVLRRRTDFQRQTERINAYNNAALESRIESGKAPAGCYDFLQLEKLGIDAKDRVDSGNNHFGPKATVTQLHAACLAIAHLIVGFVIGFLAKGGSM